VLREPLIKPPGSSVHLCVLCGLRFLLDLNQSFPKGFPELSECE